LRCSTDQSAINRSSSRCLRANWKVSVWGRQGMSCLKSEQAYISASTDLQEAGPRGSNRKAACCAGKNMTALQWAPSTSPTNIALFSPSPAVKWLWTGEVCMKGSLSCLRRGAGFRVEVNLTMPVSLVDEILLYVSAGAWWWSCCMQASTLVSESQAGYPVVLECQGRGMIMLPIVVCSFMMRGFWEESPAGAPPLMHAGAAWVGGEAQGCWPDLLWVLCPVTGPGAPAGARLGLRVAACLPWAAGAAWPLCLWPSWTGARTQTTEQARSAPCVSAGVQLLGG